jgi:hypothetical protein
MLAKEYGGLRPWELELLKPAELNALFQYYRKTEQAKAQAQRDALNG